MKIVECNVWCTAVDKQLIELGVAEGDSWMPIAVDFTRVVAIKLSGENDFLGDDKATLYFDGRELIVDISYTEAIKLWKYANKL